MRNLVPKKTVSQKIFISGTVVIYSINANIMAKNCVNISLANKTKNITRKAEVSYAIN